MLLNGAHLTDATVGVIRKVMRAYEALPKAAYFAGNYAPLDPDGVLAAEGMRFRIWDGADKKIFDQAIIDRIPYKDLPFGLVDVVDFKRQEVHIIGLEMFEFVMARSETWRRKWANHILAHYRNPRQPGEDAKAYEDRIQALAPTPTEKDDASPTPPAEVGRLTRLAAEAAAANQKARESGDYASESSVDEPKSERTLRAVLRNGPLKNQLRKRLSYQLTLEVIDELFAAVRAGNGIPDLGITVAMRGHMLNTIIEFATPHAKRWPMIAKALEDAKAVTEEKPADKAKPKRAAKKQTKQTSKDEPKAEAKPAAKKKADKKAETNPASEKKAAESKAPSKSQFPTIDIILHHDEYGQRLRRYGKGLAKLLKTKSAEDIAWREIAEAIGSDKPFEVRDFLRIRKIEWSEFVAWVEADMPEPGQAAAAKPKATAGDKAPAKKKAEKPAAKKITAEEINQRNKDFDDYSGAVYGLIDDHPERIPDAWQIERRAKRAKGDFTRFLGEIDGTIDSFIGDVVKEAPELSRRISDALLEQIRASADSKAPKRMAKPAKAKSPKAKALNSKTSKAKVSKDKAPANKSPKGKAPAKIQKLLDAEDGGVLIKKFRDAFLALKRMPKFAENDPSGEEVSIKAGYKRANFGVYRSQHGHISYDEFKDWAKKSLPKTQTKKVKTKGKTGAAMLLNGGHLTDGITAIVFKLMGSAARPRAMYVPEYLDPDHRLTLLGLRVRLWNGMSQQVFHQAIVDKIPYADLPFGLVDVVDFENQEIHFLDANMLSFALKRSEAWRRKWANHVAAHFENPRKEGETAKAYEARIQKIAPTPIEADDIITAAESSAGGPTAGAQKQAPIVPESIAAALAKPKRYEAVVRWGRAVLSLIDKHGDQADLSMESIAKAVRPKRTLPALTQFLDAFGIPRQQALADLIAWAKTRPAELTSGEGHDPLRHVVKAGVDWMRAHDGERPTPEAISEQANIKANYLRQKLSAAGYTQEQLIERVQREAAAAGITRAKKILAAKARTAIVKIQHSEDGPRLAGYIGTVRSLVSRYLKVNWESIARATGEHRATTMRFFKDRGGLGVDDLVAAADDDTLFPEAGVELTTLPSTQAGDGRSRKTKSGSTTKKKADKAVELDLDNDPLQPWYETGLKLIKQKKGKMPTITEISLNTKTEKTNGSKWALPKKLEYYGVSSKDFLAKLRALASKAGLTIAEEDEQEEEVTPPAKTSRKVKKKARRGGRQTTSRTSGGSAPDEGDTSDTTESTGELTDIPDVLKPFVDKAMKLKEDPDHKLSIRKISIETVNDPHKLGNLLKSPAVKMTTEEFMALVEGEFAASQEIDANKGKKDEIDTRKQERREEETEADEPGSDTEAVDPNVPAIIHDALNNRGSKRRTAVISWGAAIFALIKRDGDDADLSRASIVAATRPTRTLSGLGQFLGKFEGVTGTEALEAMIAWARLRPVELIEADKALEEEYGKIPDQVIEEDEAVVDDADQGGQSDVEIQDEPEILVDDEVPEGVAFINAALDDPERLGHPDIRPNFMKMARASLEFDPPHELSVVAAKAGVDPMDASMVEMHGSFQMPDLYAWAQANRKKLEAGDDELLMGIIPMPSRYAKTMVKALAFGLTLGVAAQWFLNSYNMGLLVSVIAALGMADWLEGWTSGFFSRRHSRRSFSPQQIRFSLAA